MVDMMMMMVEEWHYVALEQQLSVGNRKTIEKRMD